MCTNCLNTINRMLSNDRFKCNCHWHESRLFLINYIKSTSFASLSGFDYALFEYFLTNRT